MEEFKLLLNHLMIKVDRLDSKIQENNIILARNTVSLEEHKRRTDIAESVQKECRATCDINREEVAESLAEIKFYFKASAAVTGFVVGVIGILAGIAQIKSVWF
jgi:hypothetical protein